MHLLHPLMYILKIKGKAKIPDFVQIRDNNYTLMAYFRTDRPEKELEKCGLLSSLDKIKSVITELPYGKIQKIEL